MVWSRWAGNVEDPQLINHLWPLPGQIHSPGELPVVAGTYRMQFHCPFWVGLEVAIILLEPAQHIIIRVGLISSKTALHNLEFTRCLPPLPLFPSLLFMVLLFLSSHPVHVGFVAWLTFLGWRRWWHLLISFCRGSFSVHASFSPPLEYEIFLFLSDEAVL